MIEVKEKINVMKISLWVVFFLRNVIYIESEGWFFCRLYENKSDLIIVCCLVVMLFGNDFFFFKIKWLGDIIWNKLVIVFNLEDVFLEMDCLDCNLKLVWFWMGW